MSFTTIMFWGGLLPASFVLVGLGVAWLLVFIGRRKDEGDAPACPRCGCEPEEGGRRCAVCGAAWARRVRRHLPHWALPVLLAAGFVPAYYGLHGTLEVWPTETAKRYVHVGAAAAVVGVLEGLVALPMAVVAMLRLAVCGFAAWALLEGLRASGRFDEAGLWLTVGVVGAAGAIASLLFDAASRRMALLVVAVAGAIGAAVMSGVLMKVAHSADAARLTGAVIAMLSAIAAFWVVCRDVRVDRGGSVVILALLVALLVSGRWLGGTWTSDGWTPGLPWVSLVLLILAPGGVGVVRLPWIRTRGLVVRAAAAVVGVVGLSAAGGVSAWLLNPTPPPPAENPYADFLDDP